MIFATINLNTTKLTNCLLKSIEKQVSICDYSFLVIDVSNNENTFQIDHSINKQIKICSPSKDKYWNIESIIKEYGAEYSKEELEKYSHLKILHGSMRHAAMIQKIIDFVNEEFVLFDSDVIVKKDLNFLLEKEKFITIGHESKYTNGCENRIHPMLQYFNLNMIKEKNIAYFDGRIQHSKYKNFKHFDTGASFLYEIKKQNIPYKDINQKEYIEHFGNASWNKNVEKDVEEFLKNNRQYYE